MGADLQIFFGGEGFEDVQQIGMWLFYCFLFERPQEMVFFLVVESEFSLISYFDVTFR